jgi:hypothetical protein
MLDSDAEALRGRHTAHHSYSSRAQSIWKHDFSGELTVIDRRPLIFCIARWAV